MAADSVRDVDQVIASIRELNDHLLETGRRAGLGFLEAYEQNLRTLTDYEEKLADSSQIDWFSQMLRAQANFTRDVASAYAEAARGMLKQ
jgi:hypothetical protein